MEVAPPEKKPIPSLVLHSTGPFPQLKINYNQSASFRTPEKHLETL